MPKERFDESPQFKGAKPSPKSLAISPERHRKHGDHQARSTTTNSKSLDSPKDQVSQPKSPVKLISQSSKSTEDSQLPYVSVGCLKCGASDHVATNRNCPRPRKAVPTAYVTSAATPITKKNTARSPKKPTIENHQLKAAKLGDDTKFWYYISDDSEDGGHGDSEGGKRVQVKNDGINQDQSSTATNGGYYGTLVDNPTPTDESMQVGSSLKHTINMSSRLSTKDIVVKSGGDNANFAQPLKYGHPSTPRGQYEMPIHAVQRSSSVKTYDGGGLGTIPSLPWKAPATSPLSPIKYPTPSLIGAVKTMKPPRVRKITASQMLTGAEKMPESPETLSQKQSRRRNQDLHEMPTRSQEDVQSIANASKEMVHPPRQSPLVYSSYPAVGPRHALVNTNRTPAQKIEDSFLAEKKEIKRFKYNYMGARNTVQGPRVRYAADRVQGWRECRSMGTGLE